MSAPVAGSPLPKWEDGGECGPGPRSRWAYLPLVAAVAVIAALGLAAWWWGGPGAGPVEGFPYPFFWPLAPLGFFLVLLLVFSFTRFAFWGWHGGGAGRYGPEAREILRARFARGEISRDQLRQMLRDLNEST